jgi:hypothetical protein
MTAALQLQIFSSGSQYLKEGEVRSAISMIVFLSLAPILMSVFLWKKRKHLSSEEYHDKYGNLFTDVHLSRNRFTIYYVPITFIRRAFYVTIPVAFYLKPWL